MPPFDPRALVGRSFASVLGGIGDWRGWGIRNGRLASPPIDGDRSETEAEARKALEERVAVIVGALRGNLVRMVDATGATVPLAVWFAGRWSFNSDRGVCRLVWIDANGLKVEFYDPAFAAPAGASSSRDPDVAPPVTRQQRRRGPKPRESDEDIVRGVELARANGGNAWQATGELYGELYPPPGEGASVAERERWDSERALFMKRVHPRISKAVGG